MHLTSLRFTGFRNLDDVLFTPVPGVNVVCGENGQGKTNLLEGIFMLTGARSFRGIKDNAVIMKGREFASLTAGFYKEGREQTLRLTLSGKGRVASLNGGSERGAASFAGTFCCVVFSPEHLMLVKGSPELRRRFLDTALFQSSPAYASGMKQYVRILNQRNRLLKDCAYIAAAQDMLEVFDAQLAEAALAVTRQRTAFVEQLAPLARRSYEAIAERREQIEVRYRSSLFPDGELTVDAALERIMSLKGADLKAGFTTVGPHRDDLTITINGEDSKIFASQGQQRSMVLALKLAEAELMELLLEERPVLLLDDVLSELDENRQDALLRVMDDTQAVVTGCNPGILAQKTSATVFCMQGGKLI